MAITQKFANQYRLKAAGVTVAGTVLSVIEAMLAAAIKTSGITAQDVKTEANYIITSASGLPAFIQPFLVAAADALIDDAFAALQAP